MDGVRVITASREYFPEQYDASQAYLQRLLARFGNYMGIELRKMRLKIFSDSTPVVEVSTGLAWSIGRQGYLTMPLFGYGLADFAYARGEHHPHWTKHLRLEIRCPFRQSLR